MRADKNKKLHAAYSVLAAATILAMGGVLPAEAATLNGESLPDTFHNQDIVHAGSGKLVIGHGQDMNIQTSDSVGEFLQRFQKAKDDKKSDLEALRFALAPTDKNAPLVGVVGGKLQIDSSTVKLLNHWAIKSALGILNKEHPGLKDSIDKILKAAQDADGKQIPDNLSAEDGSYTVTVGSKTEDGKESSPLILGFIGGDASVNTGLNGKITNVESESNKLTQQSTSINRTGNITGNILSGNIIGGTGGSAAVAVGNVNANINLSGKPLADLNLGNQNKNNPTTANTAINGNVTYNVSGTSNVGVWANGGAAVALGGNSTSTVNGSSTLNISTSTPAKTIDGVVGMAAAGGAAISTLGGTATSEVKGNTNIDAKSGLSILLAGGGAAVSLDATAVYNNTVPGHEYPNGIGNDNGVSDKTISLGDKGSVTVTVNHAIEGGNATAKTGDTNINLEGTHTSLITAGGGVAGAWHSYTKKDGSGQSKGTSIAKAESGDVTINVDLNSATPDDINTVKKGLQTAISYIESIVDKKDNPTASELLTEFGKSASDISNKGIAIGILGGGIATSVSDGGTTTKSTVQDVEIKLNKGYVVGTFGGGLSANVYNKGTMAAYVKDGKQQQMSSTAEAEKAAINIYNGAKAIGVFAGGVAVSSEYGEHGEDQPTGNPEGSLSVSNVNKGAQITVNGGQADGLFGGGLAIGNSNVTGKGFDALAKVGGTSAITVNGGTIENLNLEPIMQAAQNGNTDEYPRWSWLGNNASGTMVNLKGITDHTAIAGGGMALGMSAKSNVEKSEITVSGAKVNGDILGGGIASDQIKHGDNGSQVGSSSITITGGTEVNGNIYAGGAVNTKGIISWNNDYGYEGENTASKVDSSEITLDGATVRGEISGQGYQLTTNYAADKHNNPFYKDNGVSYDKTKFNSVTGDSTLTLSGTNYLAALAAQQNENKDDWAVNSYTGNSKVHGFDIINIAANSVTVLTKAEGQDKLDENHAFFDLQDTTVNLGANAKLNISDVLPTGEDEKLTVAIHKGENTLWNSGDLVYDRLSGYAETNIGEDNGGNLVIGYTDFKNDPSKKQQAAKELTDIIGIPDLMPSIQDAFDNTNISETVHNYLEGAQTGTDYRYGFLLGEDAAVTGNAVSVARDISDNVFERLSFSGDRIAGDRSGQIGNLWVKYVHNDYNTTGQNSSVGNLGADNDYDGVLAGFDFTNLGWFRAGAALHYGQGSGDGKYSSNDYDAYGAVLYSSLRNETYGLNLMSDFGYTRTGNDIEGYAGGKKLTADRDISVWSMGLRGEKEFVFGNSQIVPYAGIRYLVIDGDSYDTYYDGGKLASYNPDTQSLWLLPVGVNLRHEFVMDNGFTITPKVELAYIFAMGDKDSNTDLTFNGGSVASSLNYDVVDDGSYLTAAGIEASYGNFTLGTGFSYQKGDDTKNQKWFFNAEYAF